MDLKWADIAFVPDEAQTAAAARAWRWMLAEPWRPLVCSMFGDLFLAKADGVFRLECPAGQINRVADDETAFNAIMNDRSEAGWARINDWFLPPLIERLREAGKVVGPGQCYCFTTLPIFVGGTYTVDNFFVAPAVEMFGSTGSLHWQLRDVPDGGQVRIKVVD